MNVNSIIEKSVNITNNLDDISSICSHISTEAKENLFDKDNYATTIIEIVKNKKTVEGKILLTRELMKQCMLSIQNTCMTFINIYDEIIAKRDEKNSINGNNTTDSISLVPTNDFTRYYFFTRPEKIIFSNYKSGTIEIESKNIEECGSIITMLTDTIATLRADISWLNEYSHYLSNSFVNDVNEELLVAIRNVNYHVLSPETVVSLTNKGNAEDKSEMIINTIDANCGKISIRSQSYKLAVLEIIKVLTAMNMNFDIMNKAIAEYVSVDSLL